MDWKIGGKYLLNVEQPVLGKERSVKCRPARRWIASLKAMGTFTYHILGDLYPIFRSSSSALSMMNNPHDDRRCVMR